MAKWMDCHSVRCRSLDCDEDSCRRGEHPVQGAMDLRKSSNSQGYCRCYDLLLMAAAVAENQSIAGDRASMAVVVVVLGSWRIP
jgi:hypothetical protein